MEKQKKEVIVVLDNIRSIFNVGSIFRTGDALGIKEIILCGTTPAPIDRFGRERQDITKVSLGAEKTLTWEYEKNTLSTVKRLRKEGYRIIIVEQSEKAVDYKKVKIKKGAKVAFVMGAEVDGVNKEIIKIADIIAEIPMRGKKESLNVSVAFGVALFRLLNV